MVIEQGYIFLVFALDGVLIGILFDFFRILRKIFCAGDFVTYAQDICFWVLSGIIFLYSMCKFCDGELRFFMVLGVLLGASIYILTLSRIIFRPISSLCINVRKKVVKIYGKIFGKMKKMRGFFVKKEKYIIDR